jgi:Mg/Co/Ni transporter MgtE
MSALDLVTKGYITQRPAEAARTLLRLDGRDIKAVFEALPRQMAASLLEHMAPSSAVLCLGHLPNKTIAEILTHMPVLSALAVLRLLNREQAKELLTLMPRPVAAQLRLRLRYTSAVVGAFVDTDVVTFHPDQSVADALRQFRREGKRTGHTIHVLNEMRQVAGVVHLSDLVSARDRSRINKIMRAGPAEIHAGAALETATNHPAWLTHDSLPVINRSGVFQGVLRRSKIMEEEQQLINELAEQNELATTREALADIFWIAVGALFFSSAHSTERNRVED